MQRARSGSWPERAVGLIAAVGEALRCHGQSLRTTGGQQLGAGEAHEYDTGVPCRHHRGDQPSQTRICGSLVVEQPVGLDVQHASTGLDGDGLECLELLPDRIAQVGRDDVDLAPPEAFAIGIARMGTDAHVVLDGQGHRGAHRAQVPGMPATADVGGGDQRQDGFVGGVEALSDVSVQVDGHAGHRTRRGSRAVERPSARAGFASIGYYDRRGAIAQLEEHLHGMQKVRGSSPRRSTTPTRMPDPRRQAGVLS